MTLYWSVLRFCKRLSQGKEGALFDLHFDDEDCKFMSPDWVTPEKQLSIINGIVMKNDTFICLGDVGSPEYIKVRIPLERNSLHASAGRLSAPNGKFLSYTGLRMFLPFSSRRNAL